MRVRAFRKKPVVIEAVQWDGTSGEAEEIVGWIKEGGGDAQFVSVEALTHSISIATLEGDMSALSGDWVIRGVAGEFYPCKSDIFEQTYVSVSHG